jgi:hypothetical protein
VGIAQQHTMTILNYVHIAQPTSFCIEAQDFILSTKYVADPQESELWQVHVTI